MLNKNENMLLRIAQADAYAICIEYVDKIKYPDLFNKTLNFNKYLQHPLYNKLSAGLYTDDTQMSCAIAEILIDKGLYAIGDDYLESFFNCFKRDPRDGYSRKFQTILEQSNSPEELKLLINNNSNSNGAAMRSVPLGIIKDTTSIIHVAYLQSSVTHNTFNAKESSALVGLMSHYALYFKDDLCYINEWLEGFCDYMQVMSKYSEINKAWELFDFETPWSGLIHNKKNDSNNLGVGINTVHAVNTLLIEETSLIGMMKRIISWGGDTDSVAAIAWGIASTRYKDEELPEFMEKDLEPNGKYGVNYLKEIGNKLMNLNI